MLNTSVLTPVVGAVLEFVVVHLADIVTPDRRVRRIALIKLVRPCELPLRWAELDVDRLGVRRSRHGLVADRGG